MALSKALFLEEALTGKSVLCPFSRHPKTSQMGGNHGTCFADCSHTVDARHTAREQVGNREKLPP